MNPFHVQPIDHLGKVQGSIDDRDFEEAVGEKYHGYGHAAFLGPAVSKKRVVIAFVALLSLFAILLARSAVLQIWQGNMFFGYAEGNRIYDQRVPSNRGAIYDRSGTILASNRPSFTLWVDEEIIEDELQYTEAVSRIAILLSTKDSDVHDSLIRDQKTVSGKILVTQDLDHQAAMMVLSSPESYPSITVQEGVARVYHEKHTEALSHILGYMSVINEEQYAARRSKGYYAQDLLGRIGIEAQYEELLRGMPGERRVETNAFGKAVTILNERDPVHGADLTLHLDIGLQAFIEERLNELSEKSGISNASVVVLDPRDGAVRALVSYPGYDNEIFGRHVDSDTYTSLIDNPARPLFARAVSGQFPSGSTFKPVVAAAGLEEGVIDERTSFLSTGGIRIGQFYFPDWKAGGHGVTDVRKAIAESVNTFFYMVGGGRHEFVGLGIKRMMNYARLFGFGEQLGIDLPGEATGFLPSESWKNEVKNEPWYIGDTYHVAIGQGDILVTPLQIASMTATIANGGTFFEPQVLDRYTQQDRAHDVLPITKKDDVVSERSIEIVREGLRQAVTSGSAIRLNSLPIQAAGKTGTAQWHSERETHAWFTGFAPYDNPELSVTVLVEEAGEGSAVAVPIAHDIFDWWFKKSY